MLHGDGVVLAGGASRRMGQPKEELRLPTGETLLVHAQKTLSETVDGIIWIARAYGHYPHDPTDLPDAVPHKGPLAGIQNALTHSQKSYLAVLAVDLPNVSVSLIRAMVHTMANDDTLNVVYAASARDRQPLVSIWHKSALPYLKEALAAPVVPSVQSILDRLSCQTVMAAEPSALVNVNTPEEWHRFLQRVSS